MGKFLLQTLTEGYPLGCEVTYTWVSAQTSYVLPDVVTCLLCRGALFVDL